MKIIAIGDTHGREFWKYIVGTQKFDKLVFIGDYFDSFDIPFEQQMQNFLNICAYKRDHPDQVIMLIGNHDFHYMPVATRVSETYSGFQRGSWTVIQQALEENKDILQMAFQHENWLFTHAGVTSTWMKSLPNEVCLDDLGEERTVADQINDVFKYKPSQFLFFGRDPYGDNVTQSPIWVRPASLMKNAYQFETLNQVVGHTGHRRLTVRKDRFFFIDTLGEGSSQEFLIIEGDQWSTNSIG